MSKAVRSSSRVRRQPRRPAGPKRTSTRALVPARPAGPAPRDDSSIDEQLSRLLDTPHLSRIVPALAPETLHAVILRRGLESSGALVTAATPEQLTAVLDMDLWQSARDGIRERFDEDRFGEWVETLVDEGESVAAGIVASMDSRLVINGLSHYIRVYDPGALLPAGDGDGNEVPAFGTGTFDSTAQIGGYIVRARRTDAWDAIVALLASLGQRHPGFFTTVMHGCRLLSDSTPEVDGLDELLTRPEQLLHDVHGAREQRRSEQGYAAAGDARAFLEMARRPRQLRAAEPSLNPIAAAYFRAADERTPSSAAPPPQPLLASPTTPEEARSVEAIVALIAGGEQARAAAQLLEGAVSDDPHVTPIRPLMEALLDVDAAAFEMRSRELAFLANTLIAGCSLQSGPFTPREGSDAALGICNLGLQQWPDRWPRPERRRGSRAAPLPSSFLADHDLVCAFEVGWALLHEEVSMFIAKRLIAVLADLRCADRDVQRDLQALRRALARECKSGTPWHALGSLEVIATLDIPAWASLRGLLGECPVLAAALTATMEGRRGSISATAFEFISTTGQIDQVHRFADRLPDMLL